MTTAYVTNILLLATGVAAIILPWIGLKRTKKDVYRIAGVLHSLVCGYSCVWIVVAFFTPVMPSYFFTVSPLLFIIALVLWFACGASDAKKEPNQALQPTAPSGRG
jgi:hypothetical protein